MSSIFHVLFHSHFVFINPACDVIGYADIERTVFSIGEYIDRVGHLSTVRAFKTKVNGASHGFPLSRE